MASRQYLTGKIPDHVDRIVEQWAAAAPDLDIAHVGVVARIHRLSQQMVGRSEAVLEPAGLTQGEFDVLSALRRGGGESGLTPGSLAAGMLVSSGGMTKRLAALERDGWIVRERSERDARSVRVRLTDTGRERLDALLPRYFAAEAEVLGALDDNEREQLAGLLRRLALQQELLR
jgi:DNA-binding MarR family transcriptional regulator